MSPKGLTPPKACDRARMAVAGLFSGIGGFELGLADAGHHSILVSENEPGAAAVLRQRFPDVPLKDDVLELDELPEETDLLVGGFPCQDLSQAGLTAGIRGDRSGLVAEVFRLLRRRRTPWVLLENVPFMLQLRRGEALDLVLRAFEDLGYRWAYRVVDSRAFGLPQRRRRVFLVASVEGDPRDVLLSDDAGEPPPPDVATWRERACGFYWTEGFRGLGWADDAVPTLKAGSTVGIPSPPAIVKPTGRIVKPDIEDAERLQGFQAGWTEPTTAVTRVSHRWKLVGNAVSVNVVRWLGERLARPGSYDSSGDARLVRKPSWPEAAWNMGEGRFESRVSNWPRHDPRPPLAEFLLHAGTPLSERATAGFRSRTRRAALRFPESFLDLVDEHLEWVRGLENS